MKENGGCFNEKYEPSCSEFVDTKLSRLQYIGICRKLLVHGQGLNKIIKMKIDETKKE